MRTILVAGMMLAAGAAAAQDFGVNVETAKERISALKPTVTLSECKNGICSFYNDREQIMIFLGEGPSGAVERFGVMSSRSNWALAAEYVAKIQRDLLVPTDQLVDVRRAAERAADGNSDILFSKFLTCKTDVGKVGSTRFSLICTRAR